MKRILIIVSMVVLLMELCSCGQEADVPTWQEQYDLGVRYLSEENYQEAILAFTAAIEIDPKRPEAFIGRGDAYMGIASGVSDDPQNTEFTEACSAAESDYQTALQLDKLLVSVYSKLADLYLLLGDKEAARAILEQGYAATADEALSQRLEELNPPEEISETVTVEGTIFLNRDVYLDELDAWTEHISESEFIVRHPSFGIRFSSPVSVKIDGASVSIQEAEYSCKDAIDEASQLYQHESKTRGPLLGKTILMTDYFSKNEQTVIFDGPTEKDGEVFYSFRPNGDYVFHIESYSEP